MQTTAAPANPFALLMDPEAVFRTIEQSGRLDGLQRRVCRPLDKPLIPRSEADAIEIDDTDDLVDDGADDSLV